MKKIILALLTLSMLLPVLTLASSATKPTVADIKNLYINAETKVGIPTTSNVNGGTDGNANYHASNVIEVKPGDVVTIGPVFVDQGYYLTAYKENGTCHTAKIAYAQCQEIAVISNNARIVKWTVPSGVAYIRMATSQMFRDSTVITVNEEFTPEEYFQCMAKQGTNVDYLKNAPATGALDNKFPATTKIFLGRSHSSEGDVLADNYRTCDYIPVKAGDVIYFGAAVTTQGYHLTLYNSSKKATTNVTKAYMVLVEDIGRGYGIYAYKIRTDSAYVRVVAATGVWDDKITLATINQPFNGDDYRKLFNISYSETAERPSSLNGLSALFMGDSISYGAGDTMSYTVPGRAWAGRIAAITGLKATNASVSGSKVSYVSGDDTAKWHYTQYEAHKNEQFDLVVMQGGVNDARYNRTVGTISDDDSQENLTKLRNTYIGGLQLLFANVKRSWPDAKLFFIANHRLDGHATGSARNMSKYFDKAEELCEKYGVVFIDLYNNEELEAKLNSKSTQYLPDTLHLNAAGYEIVTPYILNAIEAEYPPPVVETEPPIDTTSDVPAETTTAPATETAELTEPPIESNGCAGFALLPALLAVICTAAVVVIKKK